MEFKINEDIIIYIEKYGKRSYLNSRGASYLDLDSDDDNSHIIKFISELKKSLCENLKKFSLEITYSPVNRNVYWFNIYDISIENIKNIVEFLKEELMILKLVN